MSIDERPAPVKIARIDVVEVGAVSRSRVNSQVSDSISSSWSRSAGPRPALFPI